MTRVRRVHLLELRTALAGVLRGGAGGASLDGCVAYRGSIPIRAAHVTELGAAVLALE